MDEKKVIRVGSRKSQLALIQTEHVISLLKELDSTLEFEIVSMSTLGDEVLNKPLPKIGEKSLFTKELELALAASCVDFVVHSLKDLPTTLPEGMVIGAVLKREDPRDALVLRHDLKDKTLASLDAGSVIGTSSLRRIAQILRNYPHLKIEDIRGNLNTRLKKLDDLKKFSAIVLARAGLLRMGWDHRISQVLEADEILYAVGQGALAVECREDDAETIRLLAKIHCPDTLISVLAERSLLKTLGSGCSAPVAVNISLNDQRLKLIGAVWSLDGKTNLTACDECDLPLENHNKNETQKTEISQSLPKSNQLSNQSKSAQKSSQQPSSTNQLNEVDATDRTNGVRKCPFQAAGVKKKLKIDVSEAKKLHENAGENKTCPYVNYESGDHVSTLPIGVDFMGKCPYLEAKELGICPVNPEIFHVDDHVLKHDQPSTSTSFNCPYFNDQHRKLIENYLHGSLDLKHLLAHDKTTNVVNYCGLISNSHLSDKCLEVSEDLGRKVAQKLIDQGALEVMAHAQGQIRSLAAPVTK